jgi:hypothetical protein
LSDRIDEGVNDLAGMAVSIQLSEWHRPGNCFLGATIAVFRVMDRSVSGADRVFSDLPIQLSSAALAMTGQGPLQRQSPPLTGRSHMRDRVLFLSFSCPSEGPEPEAAIGFQPHAFGPGIPFGHQLEDVGKKQAFERVMPVAGSSDVTTVSVR